MHSVNGYTQILNQPDHWFDTMVRIDGYEYYGEDLISVVTRSHPFGTNNLELGHADSREIELSLFGNSNSIGRNAEINVYVRIMTADGFSGSDWIPKGTFFIDTRSKDSQYINGKEVIDIVGFDAMMRGEQLFNGDDFSDSWLDSGKGNAYELLQMCANKLEVPVEEWTSRTISAHNFQVLLPIQYSVREALKFIAALYGGSFIINDNGMLQLICLWYSQNRYSPYDIGKNMQELTIVPPHDNCVGVRMIVDAQGYKDENGDPIPDCYESRNYGSGYVYEIESPWATQDQANWLKDTLVTENLGYQPYQATNAELDPRVEIGDTVSITKPDSSFLSVRVFSQEINFGTYFTSDFGAPGEEEVDHEYSYETPAERKFSRRLYNAESTLSIHATEIDARVTIQSPEWGESAFGWILQADHWDVYSGDPDNVVLHVDADGLVVNGNGTFTGSLESGEIFIPSRDDYNFMVDRSGHMEARDAEVTGTIRASAFYTSEGDSLATLQQLHDIANSQHGGFGGGLSGLSAAALKFGNASKETSTDYPEYFTAGTFIATSGIISRGNIQASNGSVSARHFYINGSQQYGDDPIDLATHSHSISFSEIGDKIQLKITGPSGINPQTADFSIASTRTYQDMVEALTISSSRSRIGISQSSDGTEYDIDVYIRNASGELLYSDSTSTGESVYWNGYRKAEVTSMNIGVSQTSDGMAYDIDVRARNAYGELVYQDSTTTGDGVWWNGYNSRNNEVADLESRADYWEGRADYWEGEASYYQNLYEAYYDLYNDLLDSGGGSSSVYEVRAVSTSNGGRASIGYYGGDWIGWVGLWEPFN